MRTIEFKTRLNQSRITTVNEWLEGCRRIWNMALEILEENQQWFWREKSGMTDDPHPVPWRWMINEVGGEKVFGLCCDITVGRDHRLACPIKRTPGNQPPSVRIANKDPYKTLTGIFAAKNHLDKPWLFAIPSEVIRGTLRSLSDAWKEYRSGKRNRPQFKPKHKPLKSLSCNFPVNVQSDRVRFPKLGWLTCKTLAERWSDRVTPKVIKLKYLPLTELDYQQINSDIEDEKRDRLLRAAWIITYRRWQGEEISELHESRIVHKHLRYCSIDVFWKRKLEDSGGFLYNGFGKKREIGNTVTDSTSNNYPVIETQGIKLMSTETKKLKFKRC